MNAKRLEFIKKISLSARLVCAGTGLFPSVLIAQAAIESANGTSGLSRKHHNYFGVKAIGGWMGPKVVLKTREVIKGESLYVFAPFRVYESIEESLRDRCAFLAAQPRYTKHGVFSAATPEAQADALQAAGYATDPLYAKTIKDVIRIYGLKEYDKDIII